MLSPNSQITPIKLHSLTSSELLQRTKEIALEERRIGIELLHYLLEVDRRRVFVPQFSSLHEYVVRELGYSDGAAHRRISAMRLLRNVPELEPRLRDGSVNLSTASLVQNFMTIERRISGTPILPNTARELVEQISGKSARETEALLAARSPRVAAVLQERPRSIDGQNVQVTIVLSPDLQQKLRRLRDRMAHHHPNPSLAEQLELLADFALRKLERVGGPSQGNQNCSEERLRNSASPRTRSAASEENSATSSDVGAAPRRPPEQHSQVSRNSTDSRGPTETEDSHKSIIGTKSAGSHAPKNARERSETIGSASSRMITLQHRRLVWRRAGAQCEFRHSNGSRCSRTHRLQIDHRIPVAWGGGREPANLQLLCTTHNQWKSDRLPGA